MGSPQDGTIGSPVPFACAQGSSECRETVFKRILNHRGDTAKVRIGNLGLAIKEACRP